MFSQSILSFHHKQETRRRNSCSPLGSTGSSSGSWRSGSSKEDEKNSSEETGKLSNALQCIRDGLSKIIFREKAKQLMRLKIPHHFLSDYTAIVDGAAAGDVANARNDDEGWDMITCFCGKPFAGRPMIECSGNFEFHHLVQSTFSNKMLYHPN
jgi:hypothetical protein